LLARPHPRSTLFPYTTLFRSRDPLDVEDVHAVMDEMGARLPVIAKIEKPEAVERLGPITRAFDGLMVARGDLGVEIPLEHVPLLDRKSTRLNSSHVAISYAVF